MVEQLSYRMLTTVQYNVKADMQRLYLVMGVSIVLCMARIKAIDQARNIQLQATTPYIQPDEHR